MTTWLRVGRTGHQTHIYEEDRFVFLEFLISNDFALRATLATDISVHDYKL